MKLLLLAVLFTSSGVFASVRIEVPQTELSESTRSGSGVSEKSAFRSSRIEVSVMNWQPNFASFSSRIEGATAFGSEGLPSLGVSAISARGWFSGIFLTRLTRQGTSYLSGQSQNVEQALTLVSARFGFERSIELGRKVSLLGSLGLCPTLGLSARSRFDDGREFFEFPVEVGAGLVSQLSVFNKSWKSADFRVSVVRLSGLSLRAGLSVALD